MDSKYYTPSIDEVHVGFRCEHLVGKHWHSIPFANWFDGEVKEGAFELLPEALKENRIRVKFLDREDIESLGFRHDMCRSLPETSFWGYSKDKKYLLEFNLLSRESEVGHKDFDKWLIEPTLSIKDMKPSSIGGWGPTDTFIQVSQVIFRGCIKNKSELQTIMKMLNI